MSTEAVTADTPALEVELELELLVTEEMLKRDIKVGRHGPSLIRDNSVVSMIYEARTHRIFAGMQLGDILCWDLKYPQRNNGNVLYSAYSQPKIIGQHAVCTFAR
jgi:hypothetical protein